jgi:hypothetical protein
MPVHVTEYDYVSGNTYLIRYGVESVEWFEADSQAEMFRILAQIAEDGYISAVTWEKKQ